MLNFKVRLQQKWFWITLIPLLFLLIDQVTQVVELAALATLGELSGSEFQNLVLAMVGTLFAILALVGFPVDLTTEGYGDSARALNYEVPAMNASEEAMLEEGQNILKMISESQEAQDVESKKFSTTEQAAVNAFIASRKAFAEKLDAMDEDEAEETVKDELDRIKETGEL